MRILVTGGAGFIGSHIVDAYVRAGHEVAVLDDHSTGKPENLKQAARSGLLTVFEGDVCDAQFVGEILDAYQPEIINHHAARVDVAWCEEHPEETQAVNVESMGVLLSAATRAPVKRIIFAGSVGAYGECGEPADESQPLVPVGVYGRSKVDAERCLCDACHHTDRAVPTRIILRYANVYGPRASGGVVPAFVRDWMMQERPTVYGDGEQVRDFVHVHDVARANLLAIDHLELPVGSLRIFNIASGHPVTVNQLWTMVSAEFEPARSADILISRIDAARAAEELGFEPRETLHEGVIDLLVHF